MPEKKTGDKKVAEDKIFNPYTGKYHEIPVEGSLGILALGAAGLKAWRKRKAEEGINSPKKENG
jgi:hypothetical protein